MATYRTLAIVDDVNTCDCCGKSNLKSTVAMERDDGEVLHFGSTCATRHSGRAAKTIKAEAVSIAAARQAAADSEFRTTTEYLALNEKLAEAHRQRIRPGRAFGEAVRDAATAARQAAAAIAMKHGVQYVAS